MTPPPFSRMMTLEEARRQFKPLVISADEHQRGAIADRFGWIAVDALTATLTIGVSGATVDISMQLKAQVVQSCIASGQSVAESIDAPFAVRLVPARLLEAARDDEERELGDEDLDVSGYADDRFDLADLIAETLALAVNPWPRSHDADEWLSRHGVVDEDAAGPFGTLAALRDAMKKGQATKG